MSARDNCLGDKELDDYASNLCGQTTHQQEQVCVCCVGTSATIWAKRIHQIIYFNGEMTQMQTQMLHDKYSTSVIILTEHILNNTQLKGQFTQKCYSLLCHWRGG